MQGYDAKYWKVPNISIGCRPAYLQVFGNAAVFLWDSPTSLDLEEFLGGLHQNTIRSQFYFKLIDFCDQLWLLSPFSSYLIYDIINKIIILF